MEERKNYLQEGMTWKNGWGNAGGICGCGGILSKPKVQYTSDDQIAFKDNLNRVCTLIVSGYIKVYNNNNK